MKLDVQQLKNPMVWTVCVLIVSSMLAAFIGQALLLSAAVSSAFAFGILGLAMFFVVFTLQAITGIVVVLIVPVWAIVVGWLVATGSASRAAHASTKAGVTLFAETHPIHVRVNELAQQLELPPIKWVGWFAGSEINAFAMGVHQEEAMIAFSQGAIEKLTKEELDAVMAHELAHVVNEDMARMTYAYGVQNALTWFLFLNAFKQLARWLFTPLSELEIMRFSRQREYWADAIGAALTSPVAMASALVKIKKDKGQPTGEQSHISHFMFQAQAHAFFATHPTIEERVHALADKSYIEQLPFKEAVNNTVAPKRPVEAQAIQGVD